MGRVRLLADTKLADSNSLNIPNSMIQHAQFTCNSLGGGGGGAQPSASKVSGAEAPAAPVVPTAMIHPYITPTRLVKLRPNLLPFQK